MSHDPSEIILINADLLLKKHFVLSLGLGIVQKFSILIPWVRYRFPNDTFFDTNFMKSVLTRLHYLPYKRFKMKLQSNLNCHICNTTSSGTFLHMFWECPVVISLWTHVNLVLSSLLRIDWSVNPSLCRLNDDSGLCISSMQKRMLFAGFTAVKKTIIQNWFTPHMCREAYWIRSLLQIVSCECTTARVGGARPSTIEAWQCFLLNIRDYLKE